MYCCYCELDRQIDFIVIRMPSAEGHCNVEGERWEEAGGGGRAVVSVNSTDVLMLVSPGTPF